MSEKKLWTPVHLDSDFDLQDFEGGLICLQGSCASDEMMCEIAISVNYHERLVNYLRLIVDEIHEKDPDGEILDNTFTEGAVKLLATLEAEKGGEL